MVQSDSSDSISYAWSGKIRADLAQLFAGPKLGYLGSGRVKQEVLVDFLEFCVSDLCDFAHMDLWNTIP